jgi:hypothetical protein
MKSRALFAALSLSALSALGCAPYIAAPPALDPNAPDPVVGVYLLSEVGGTPFPATRENVFIPAILSGFTCDEVRSGYFVVTPDLSLTLTLQTEHTNCNNASQNGLARVDSFTGTLTPLLDGVTYSLFVEPQEGSTLSLRAECELAQNALSCVDPEELSFTGQAVP